MDRYYARYLVDATLQNGVLRVAGLITSEIKQLNVELRNDLLKYNIPHRKVLGIHIKALNGCWMSDFVSKVQGIEKSYVEMFVSLNDFIMNEYRRMDKKEIILSTNHKVETTNGSLIQISTREVVDSLIRNVPIINFEKMGSTLYLLTYHAKGMLDFSASSRILRGTEYKPLRVVYDLNSVFTVKQYQEGDDAIFFMYKREINEFVLLNILRCYAMEICEGDGSNGSIN